jgi:hypothetical protein
VPTPLAAHLAGAPDTDVAALLAVDARFASPFADYTGREQIAHLFGLMPRVIKDVTVVRELRGSDEILTVLRGRIGEHPTDAFLDERYAPDGSVAEVMLMLRPLAAIKEAVTRMGGLLS